MDFKEELNQENNMITNNSENFMQSKTDKGSMTKKIGLIKSWYAAKKRSIIEKTKPLYNTTKEAVKKHALESRKHYDIEQRVIENKFNSGMQWFNSKPESYRDLAMVLIIVTLFASFMYIDQPKILGKITAFTANIKSHLSFAKSAPPAPAPAPAPAPPPGPSPAPAPVITRTATPAPATAPPPTLSAAQNQKISQTILASAFVKDIPEKYPISLTFFTYWNGQRITQTSFLIGRGQLLSSGTPAIKLTLHSKYVDQLNGNNLCDIIKTANKAGDLGFESSYSTASLLFKYVGMLKYRSCFGF